MPSTLLNCRTAFSSDLATPARDAMLLVAALLLKAVAEGGVPDKHKCARRSALLTVEAGLSGVGAWKEQVGVTSFSHCLLSSATLHAVESAAPVKMANRSESGPPGAK